MSNSESRRSCHLYPLGLVQAAILFHSCRTVPLLLCGLPSPRASKQRAEAAVGKVNRTRVSSHLVYLLEANTGPGDGENAAGQARSGGGRNGRRERAVNF